MKMVRGFKRLMSSRVEDGKEITSVCVEQTWRVGACVEECGLGI
jgi:hypothetical protein